MTPRPDITEQAVLDAIARRVRVRRVAQGLTQEDLANRAHIAITSLQFVERGGRRERKTMSTSAYLLSTLWPIVDALGMTMARFMRDVDVELGLRPPPADQV